MGPDKDSSALPKNQDAGRIPRTEGRWRRARRPRRRVCLLKGCGQVFRPEQPPGRYCSEVCRQQARRWRQWKARQRYRQSANGKHKRQAQSRRYRQRRKEGPARETAGVTAARVIPTNFFRAPATARDAMRSLIVPGGRPCSAFVPPPAATLWSEFSIGSGAGAHCASARRGWKPAAKRLCPGGDESLPIGSGNIALTPAVAITSRCAQGEEEGARPAEVHAASFSVLQGGRKAWKWNFIGSNFATSG
jgi:hypothetical protein